MSAILSTLASILKERLYQYVAFFSSIALLVLLLFLQSRTVGLTNFFTMAANGEYGSWGVPYAYTYATLLVIVAVLFGVSMAVLTWQFRHSKLRDARSMKDVAQVFGGGSLASLAAGCPVCGAFLLGALGVAGGLAIFPLKGLELQFLSVAFIGSSVVFGAKRAGFSMSENCNECKSDGIEGICQIHEAEAPILRSAKRALGLPQDLLVSILIGIFIINQFMVGQVSAELGGKSTLSAVANIFSIQSASAQTILMPMLNEDGSTTSIKLMPTITEVPAEGNSGDVVADALVVMQATGTPFYAPEGISFDDPIGALELWGTYDKSVTLSDDLQERYDDLTSRFTCNFCCGSPTRVTTVNRCGCAHSAAARGFFNYMLNAYSDTYTNEQLIGEAYRWMGIWYPEGTVQDYLLATDRGEVIGHKNHGGAGADGMHGFGSL
ncbi:MAG: hypothetical protein WC654_02895 [Patescibacteria group bacterium]